MKGGGSWRLGPGQVTGYSEITLCLMNALAKPYYMQGKTRTVLNLDEI